MNNDSNDPDNQASSQEELDRVRREMRQIREEAAQLNTFQMYGAGPDDYYTQTEQLNRRFLALQVREQGLEQGNTPAEIEQAVSRTTQELEVESELRRTRSRAIFWGEGALQERIDQTWLEEQTKLLRFMRLRGLRDEQIDEQQVQINDIAKARSIDVSITNWVPQQRQGFWKNLQAKAKADAEASRERQSERERKELGETFEEARYKNVKALARCFDRICEVEDYKNPAFKESTDAFLEKILLHIEQEPKLLEAYLLQAPHILGYCQDRVAEGLRQFHFISRSHEAEKFKDYPSIVLKIGIELAMDEALHKVCSLLVATLPPTQAMGEPGRWRGVQKEAVEVMLVLTMKVAKEINDIAAAPGAIKWASEAPCVTDDVVNITVATLQALRRGDKKAAIEALRPLGEQADNACKNWLSALPPNASAAEKARYEPKFETIEDTIQTVDEHVAGFDVWSEYLKNNHAGAIEKERPRAKLAVEERFNAVSTEDTSHIDDLPLDSPEWQAWNKKLARAKDATENIEVVATTAVTKQLHDQFPLLLKSDLERLDLEKQRVELINLDLKLKKAQLAAYGVTSDAAVQALKDRYPGGNHTPAQAVKNGDTVAGKVIHRDVGFILVEQFGGKKRPVVLLAEANQLNGQEITPINPTSAIRGVGRANPLIVR